MILCPHKATYNDASVTDMLTRSVARTEVSELNFLIWSSLSAKLHTTWCWSQTAKSPKWGQRTELQAVLLLSSLSAKLHRTTSRTQTADQVSKLRSPNWGQWIELQDVLLWFCLSAKLHKQRLGHRLLIKSPKQGGQWTELHDALLWSSLSAKLHKQRVGHSLRTTEVSELSFRTAHYHEPLSAQSHTQRRVVQGLLIP